MARQDAALWSINERLGQLLEHLGVEKLAGADLGRPSLRWAAEIVKVFTETDEDKKKQDGEDPLPYIPDMAITQE